MKGNLVSMPKKLYGNNKYMKLIISYRIKEIREEQGMTIRELERQSGVSRSQISDIENHNKDATVTTLCMIAIALGVLPSELFEIKVINL